MNQKDEILKQTVIEDEKPVTTLADKLREQKRVKNKKTTRTVIISIVVLLFAGLLYLLFKPYKASADYGICRTLLELVVPYPHTIHVSEVDDLRNNKGLRMWYTHTDAFGEYRMEKFICNLGLDPDTGRLKISEIKLNKVNMDSKQVDHLSNALILFEEAPLIMNYPVELPDSLGSLHFDFDMYRRVQLNNQKYKGP